MSYDVMCDKKEKGVDYCTGINNDGHSRINPITVISINRKKMIWSDC